MLRSDVVGLDVYNGQKAKIGKIQDVAFDASKEVTGLYSVNRRFLGMGTRYVAVNPTAVIVSYDAEHKTWRADQGRAQVGAGIQVRRPVDRQQELSGKSAERSSNSPFRPNVEDKQKERLCPIRRQTSIAFGH